MRFRDLKELIRLSYGEESRPGSWADGIDADFLEDLRSRNVKRQAELWMEQAQALNWHTFLSWFDRCYNFCGLENVWGPEISGYQDQLTYCNAGDSYALTLAWDHADRKFLVTTTGDWQAWKEPIWLKEAWEDSLATEFEQQLEKRLNLFRLEGDSDNYKELFDLLCQKKQVYPCLDGQAGSQYWLVDWDALLQGVSRQDLTDYNIEFEGMED